MVPLRADVLKGQAEWRTAAGRKRRGTEIDRVLIASALSEEYVEGISSTCVICPKESLNVTRTYGVR